MSAMENSGMGRRSIAELFNRDCCAICNSIHRFPRCSSGDSKSRLQGSVSTAKTNQAAQRDCSISANDSEAAEPVQIQSDHDHKAGNINNNVKGSSTKKDPCEIPCPLSSSLYYGGPDDHYRTAKTGMEGQYGYLNQQVKLKQLEEATDPFNLECATRGNWWEGSLHY